MLEVSMIRSVAGEIEGGALPTPAVSRGRIIPPAAGAVGGACARDR